MVMYGGASGAGMVWRAAAAIQAGMCETVLCVLGNARDDNPPRSPNRNPIREFDVPFGASGANISYALFMQAHMARFGTTAEDFATIAHWARHNAQSNPDAIFHGKPASVADVLASPIVTAARSESAPAPAWPVQFMPGRRCKADACRVDSVALL